MRRDPFRWIVSLLVGVATFLAVMGLIVACGGASSADENPVDTKGVSVITVKVGTETYNCVLYNSYEEAGLSCDFDHPIR